MSKVISANKVIYVTEAMCVNKVMSMVTGDVAELR